MKTKKIINDVKLREAIKKEIGLLKKKLHDPGLVNLIDTMECRLEYHRGQIINRERTYKRWGNILTWIILISSPFLIFIQNFEMNNNIVFADTSIKIASLLFTLIAVTNSSFKFGEKSAGVSLKLINLHDWEMDLLFVLREFEHEKIDLNNVLRKKDKKLSEIAENITSIDNFSLEFEPKHREGNEILKPGQQDGEGLQRPKTNPSFEIKS
jgi:hypothetical protein